MSEMNDWNQQVINEFRQNGGKVAQLTAFPLLLLHHKGAKSGKSYVNPLAYLQDGDRKAIFASKAGAPTNPDWYHNLIANPEVEIEDGSGQRVPVRAVVADAAERDRLYEKQAGIAPQFAEYERNTDRKIPVVLLEPR